MEHSQEEQKLLVSSNVGEVEEGHPLKGAQAQDGQSEISYVQLKLHEHMLTHTGLQVGFSGSAAGFYRAPHVECRCEWLLPTSGSDF